MFWGAFGLNMKPGLRFIEGIMTGQVYRGILEEHVLPLVKQHNKGSTSRRNGVVFQQDNDPKHTCKLVREYLESTGLEVLKWPSCSPDLNPIENLWSIVNGKVYRRFSKTITELRVFLVEE